MSAIRRKIVVIGILVVLLMVSIFLAVLSGWLFHSRSTTRSAAPFGPIDVQDRTALQGNTHIIIPPSANGLHGVINGDQTITTHMRFDIPAVDLDEALKNTSCSLATTSVDVRTKLQDYPKRDWWAPGKAQTFVSCDTAGEHIVQKIFVDMTDPQHYIIYVIASTK